MTRQGTARRDETQRLRWRVRRGEEPTAGGRPFQWYSVNGESAGEITADPANNLYVVMVLRDGELRKIASKKAVITVVDSVLSGPIAIDA